MTVGAPGRKSLAPILMAHEPTRPGTTPTDFAVWVAVLSLAYVVKRHYSTASADELRWILGPSAAVAGVLTGSDFAREAGVGYVSPVLSTIIAPACAGVNYFVIAVSMLGIGFSRKVGSVAAKWGWLLASTAVAYAATVLVNGVRIAIGVALHTRAPAGGPFSAPMLHRVEGTVVYLSSLWVLFSAVEWALDRHRNSTLRGAP